MDKLSLLGQYMQFEPAEEVGNTPRPPADCPMEQPAGQPRSGACKPADLPITNAHLPNGKTMPLLKTMLTSACERNCNYCAFRAGRNFRRTTFSPDELSQTYMKIYNSGVARGVFLSSGVAGGGMRTQDRLLDTAEILRTKQEYQGYLASEDHAGRRPRPGGARHAAGRPGIDQSGSSHHGPPGRPGPAKGVSRRAARPPCAGSMRSAAASPVYQGWKGRWPSSVTQFVAGGSGENDLELLQTSEYLHRKLRLARVYFSGFSPVPDTPLENQAAINPWRTHRLYQADFLLRDYGFTVEDLPFTRDGLLPLETDPKLAWARTQPGRTTG